MVISLASAFTKAAAARPAEPDSAQSRRVAPKVVRRKTAKANEKK
jgi:hypothetical protein